MSKRVGAINDVSDSQVEFFGFGNYVGDFVPTEAVGWLADIAKEVGRKNPKIELDNGEFVYGCECWWGGEDAVKKEIEKYKVEGLKIVNVLPSDIRKQYLAEEGAVPPKDK